MTDVIEGANLSREACTTLGIIPSDFSHIESATQQPMSVSSAAASPPDEECDWLLLPHTPQTATIINGSVIPSHRRQPGQYPEWHTTQIPIQHFQHLRKPYTPSNGVSALGTSRRPQGQADRSPQTYSIGSSSASILATWSEDEIDRDVKLKILDVVPVGEPVTWCHRLVTARKKTASRDAQWTGRCSTNLLPSVTKKTITDA